MKFANTVGLLVATLVPFEASAQQSLVFLTDQETLGLVRAAHLYLDDQVSDGCWTNTDTVLSRVRLLFEQNSIPIYDEPFAFSNIHAVNVGLAGLGYRAGSVCSVSADFHVWFAAYSEIGGYEGQNVFSLTSHAQKFSRSFIATSPSNANAQLSDWFVGVASEYISDVISARRLENVQLYFSIYPTAGSEPVTVTQFQEYLESREQ